MLASTYSSSTSFNFPRRMLLHTPFFHHKPPPPPPSLYPLPPKSGGSSIDANVVMIFSVLLCLLIFSICVNCIIRCMLKCLMMISQDHQGNNNNQQKEVSNCGVKKRALKTFPVVKYSKEVAKVKGLSTECVICLSEFKGGVKIRVLPKCNHGFHVKCIDKWLSSNSSCPTCRQSMVDTCHKVIGSHDGDQQYHHHEDTSSSSSSSSLPSSSSPLPSSSLPSSSSDVDHVVVNILPLGREDVIRN